MHFDAADVDVSRADAVVVAFHLDPGADFDVDCASGVNPGVDVDAAPHVDVDAVNDDVADNANTFGRPEQIIPRQKHPETYVSTLQGTSKPMAVFEPWTKQLPRSCFVSLLAVAFPLHLSPDLGCRTQCELGSWSSRFFLGLGAQNANWRMDGGLHLKLTDCEKAGAGSRTTSIFD